MFKKIATNRTLWKCNRENWQCENVHSENNYSGNESKYYKDQGYFPDRKSCLSKCNRLGSTPDALLTQIFPYLTSQNISQLSQSSSKFNPSLYKDNAMIKHIYEQKLLAVSKILSQYHHPNIADLIYKLNMIEKTLSEIEAIEGEKKKMMIISVDIYLILLENLNTIIQTLINYDNYMIQHFPTIVEKSPVFINLIENYTKIFIQIATTKTFKTKPYKTLYIVWDLMARSATTSPTSIYRETFENIHRRLWKQIMDYFAQLNQTREYLETLNFSDLLDIYSFMIQNYQFGRIMFETLDIKADSVLRNLIVIIIEKYFKNEIDVDDTNFWNFIHTLITSGYEDIKLILENFNLWNTENDRALTILEIIQKLESDDRITKFWMTFLVEILLNFQIVDFGRLFPSISLERFLFEIISKYDGKVENFSIDPSLRLLNINYLISIFQSIYSDQHENDFDCETINECKERSSYLQKPIEYLESLPKDIFFYKTVRRSINILRDIKKQITEREQNILKELNYSALGYVGDYDYEYLANGAGGDDGFPQDGDNTD